MTVSVLLPHEVFHTIAEHGMPQACFRKLVFDHGSFLKRFCDWGTWKITPVSEAFFEKVSRSPKWLSQILNVLQLWVQQAYAMRVIL